MQDDLVGAHLGNYEVEEPLGSGGMAQVYRAWDTTLKRLVAIKVIAPNLSTQERYRERFEREAQSIAALDHPNIVPVYYFGKLDGLYYLAMKFIEGEDLGALMNRYAIAGEYLPADDILRITERIADALDYAHSKGVIHRDVKPSNIMVDRDGHPYLSDFGLALNLSQGTVGDVLGTPHYVSPEQARNSADAVPQSDIYSLGVVLYEIFTGVVPFDDPSPTAIALQHMTKEPPAPRSLNPDLSPELEAVILRAMAKQPENRYQSGHELAVALRIALESADQSRDTLASLPLPPLPPGMQPPPPRRPSMRPVAAEVRASLSQRTSAQAAQGSHGGTVDPRTAIRNNADQPTSAAQPDRNTRPSYLPLLVLAGVIVAVIVIVAVVALSLNRNTPSVTMLPTTTATDSVDAAPTTVAFAVTDEAASNTPVPPSPSPEPPTASAIPPSSTPVPPTATSVPPTPTPVPPTSEPPTATIEPATDEPPTVTPLPAVLLAATSTPVSASEPTAAPSNWLPVRFLYDANAFYWMNDSSSTIRVEAFAFERMDGTDRFDANRFAYYSMQSGRCMEIMFVDVARNSCPEGRRPNAFFTPSRTQGVDFWTGSGQFRVLWNGNEIAVCEIDAGQCSAFIPAS